MYANYRESHKDERHIYDKKYYRLNTEAVKIRHKTAYEATKEQVLELRKPLLHVNAAAL